MRLSKANKQPCGEKRKRAWAPPRFSGVGSRSEPEARTDIPSGNGIRGTELESQQRSSVRPETVGEGYRDRDLETNYFGPTVMRVRTRVYLRPRVLGKKTGGERAVEPLETRCQCRRDGIHRSPSSCRSFTGTGFSGATLVDFGTAAATKVAINSATQITATSPAGTVGAVNVTVVTPGGTSPVSSADQFNYVAAPAVTPVGDSGFESVQVGAGKFAYDPTGLAWTFAGGAGISANGSAFTAGNPAAPQGSQVALNPVTASIRQSVEGWSGGTYTISFDAA